MSELGDVNMNVKVLNLTAEEWKRALLSHLHSSGDLNQHLSNSATSFSPHPSPPPALHYADSTDSIMWSLPLLSLSLI